jgi:glyoxylase-like metal-dependent hydrolase (beta-lactamase superfamily II)
MRLFFHFTLPHLSNTYLLANETGGDAVIIDPGAMDVPLLQLVEENNYYIRSILVTHAAGAHTDGIRTIRKIYNAEIYSANRQINDVTCKSIADGDSFVLHGLPVQVIGAQGFSRDSVIFKIHNAIFTGDVLSAGMVGHVPNAFSKALLITKLKERFASLDDRTPVFPGYGPPTSIGLEMYYNPDLIASL